MFCLFSRSRSLRQSVVASNKHLRKQLDSFEDHRPYFTYWTCTVQVLVMLVAVITYGFGPVGFNLNRRSGLVRFLFVCFFFYCLPVVLGSRAWVR